MTIIQIVVPMAATPATAAAIANTVSTGWAAAAAAAVGETGAAVVVRGAATGAAVPAGLGAAGAAPGMPPGAPVGGRVGNLIVGAADGLGGKVIRTVSFFGWTLPVDFFMGVTGAPGTPGGTGGCGLSAIINLSSQHKGRVQSVKLNLW